MSGITLLGHGGPDMLRWRDDLDVPQPGKMDVIVRVAAEGVNNTDINTRTGWYSKGNADASDAGWSGTPLAFPRIQGADVCGTSAAKARTLSDLGATQTFLRDDDLTDKLGPNSVDVVIDLVAGPQWPFLLDVLRPFGRYGVAGAIGGVMVELDVRTLYLKDLSFYGCTVLDPEVFGNLVQRIERKDIKPLVAETYPLRDIATAQDAFQKKHHTGKIVLVVD